MAKDPTASQKRRCTT